MKQPLYWKVPCLLLPLLVIAACDGGSNDKNKSACTGVEVPSQRLFLQQVSASQAIVKWRGDATGLCYGTDAQDLTELVEAVATETGHMEALITGLEPDTDYFYSVGAAPVAPAGQRIHTAPETGSLPADGNVHVWIVGDSGTAGLPSVWPNPGVLAVRDGFLAYNAANGDEPLDAFLMLGDNAYFDGSDAQHQLAIFEVFTDILPSVSLWPTVGNHEMGSAGGSKSADVNDYSAVTDPNEPATRMPYLDIFTLPTDGEAGGVASGTEQYYSFDYANVHFVSLDSQVSSRDTATREAMKDWLVQDLGSNDADWTVVIYHHPVYTKGSHDSDDNLNGVDQPIFDMREQFIPLFDQYGVDVVYSGHSHSYERSFYLHNHTGLSTTFDPLVHAEVDSDGTPLNGRDNQSYRQISIGSGADDKSVYTVAGSSGYTSHMQGVHPANFSSLEVLGSVVLDISENRLQASFIDDTGTVRDWFAIER